MLKKYVYGIMHVTLLTTALHAQESPFSRIAQAHLAALPVIEKPASNKPKTLTEQLQPWAAQHITDRDVYAALYERLGNSTLPTLSVFNNNGMKDLELVCGNGNEVQATVLNTIKPATATGNIYTAYLLNNPTADVAVLKNRQHVIKVLAQDTLFMERASTYLSEVKECEQSMLTVLKDTEANQRLAEVLFYTNNWPVLKHLKAFNKSIIFQDLVSVKNYTLALGISGMSLATVAAGAKYYHSNPEAFKAFINTLDTNQRLSILYFMILGPYISYALKTTLIDPELHAQKAVIGFARLLKCVDLIASQNLQLSLDNKDTMNSTGLIKKYTEDSQAQLSSPMKKLINLLRKNTFKGNESYFSHHGNSKVAYALLLECKDELHELFEIVGEFDAYVACAKLIQTSETQKNGYCFAEYVEHAAAPSISATHIWHPLVGPQKSVTNTIELGGENRANVILTGPNAGGKSTFLKGLTLNVLFAQSFGIVPAKRFVFTPFVKINTYMNIADDTAGGNSLFKSEVLRAQSLLNTVKNLPTGQFSFSVMDEMFSGTSPKEGEAASYAVAEKLGSLPNSMLLLATHFQKLTALQDATGNFKNYQVRVVRHDNGTFSYPFKLEEGKADQNVAIEILQQQGFDTSILDSANAILNQ